MLAMLPWILLVAGLASLAWIVAGMMLRRGHAVRAAAAMLLPGIVVGTGFFLAYLDPGYAIPDPHEASLHPVLVAIIALAVAAATVVVTVPMWFLLEMHLGHRARRD